ncbi:MAG: glycosyltransferase family 9 protein [Nanoarchaeota archaeon]
MRTLIIKTGALGDVVRTTVLLNEIEGDIYWITKKNADDLLQSDKITKKIFVENMNDVESLKDIYFDIVLSLEEDKEILKSLDKFRFGKLIGVYLDKNENFDYTPEGKEWFDMSLASIYGKDGADSLKKKNRKSHAQIFIEMLGKEFNGQEYDMGYEPKICSGVIGIISECKGIWPSKAWSGYETLKKLLEDEGYEVRNLGMKPTLMEHIEDINSCEVVVCGDTLGMHIALALKKKVVSLFNCTSPYEIYDYGRMTKIVSSLYEKFFYSKEFHEELVNSIPVKDVLEAVEKKMIEKL